MSPAAFYQSVFPYFQSYLLVVHDLPVSTAGQIIQVFTFSATITSILASLAIKHRKRYRFLVFTGACVYVLGLFLMLIWRRQESSMALIVVAQMLIGIGGGMCHGPAQVGVQASARHSEVAATTAAFLTLLEIGGAVGSAISGAIWSSSVPEKLARYLPPETKDRAQEIYGSIRLASHGWPMGDPTRVAINKAYQETMTNILTVAVWMALPCVFLSLVMENHKLDEIDQGVTGVVIGHSEQDLIAEAGPSSARLLGDDDEDEDEDEDEDATIDEASGQKQALLPSRQRKDSR